MDRFLNCETKQAGGASEAAFLHADCGLIVHTLDGSRVISVNPAALDILGYSSKEALESDGFYLVSNTVADADKALVRQAILSLKPGGDSVSVSYRVYGYEGEVRYVEGVMRLIEDGGEILCQRTLIDCTERRRREKDEAMLHHQLMQALSSDYNQVCWLDLATGDGGSIREHYCRYGVVKDLFKQGADVMADIEEYGRRCVHSDDRESFLAAFSFDSIMRRMQSESGFFLDYRTDCAGSVHHFRARVLRMGDWTERFVVVIGFRNVDGEVCAERWRREQLEAALEAAQRASRAKSAFLSNMSHDIRTPMNAVIGFTTLALSHLGSTALVEEYLKKILSSGNHLLSLINDVLDMSRIESGRMSLEASPCSLPDILHGVRDIIQSDIKARRLELRMDASGVAHEDVVCDRLRLNQVLLNVAGNAVKYTEAGGHVSIRVRELPCKAPGTGLYEFRISDTGIGMDECFLSHIFEPFERERNTTLSGIQGTGLGMAITKNIVDMMGGEISVSSKKGEGTEFVLRIPMLFGEPKDSGLFMPEFSGMRALVVDDDFNACDSATSMLSQIGMRAEWTLSGKEAVMRARQAVLRGEPYSVYIVDWMIPDMNGVEVARQIRKEAGSGVPIIILTACDWIDIEDDARDAGVVDFCGKPLFFSDLQRSLKNAMQRGSTCEERMRPLRHGRLLLVEDNELNREIAEEILKCEGYEVECACDGAEAVDAVSRSVSGYYAAVLMDIQMPVLDGYGATHGIRSLPDKAVASVPIIAMTANAFDEDRRLALEAGMDGYVPKPIDIPSLLSALDSVSAKNGVDKPAAC